MDELQVGVTAATQVCRHQVSLDCVTRNSWDTWEELLLASAVKKHGTDKWGLVSAELRDRASARNTSSSTFTPEACRSEYYVLRGRYGEEGDDREGDLHDDIPWFEELRKLRVAQLKRELERFDSSIGVLKFKLERLRSEREKSAHVGYNELGETAIGYGENECKADAARSISSSDASVFKTSNDRSNGLFLRRQACGDVYGYSELGRGHLFEEEGQRQESNLWVTGPKHSDEEFKAFDCTREPSEDIPPECDVPQNMQLLFSEQHDQEYVCVGCRDVPSREQSRSFSCERGSGAAVSLSNVKEVGADVSISEETLAGSQGIKLGRHEKSNDCYAANEGEDISSQTQKSSDLNAADDDEARLSLEAETGETARIQCGLGRGAKPMGSEATADAMDSNVGAEEQEEFANVETRHSRVAERADSPSNSGTFVASKEPSFPSIVVPVRTPLSDLDCNQEGSETVNSPRLKLVVPSKHKLGNDGGVVSKGSSDSQVAQLDDGPKNATCRAVGNKTVPELQYRAPIESADSTIDKQREEVPPLSEARRSSDQVHAVTGAKLQSLSLDTASKTVAAVAQVQGIRDCLVSSELIIDSKRSNADMKNPSITFSENSELREVWGESAEVIADDESKPARKKQRVTGLGKKRKSKKSITKDLASLKHDDATEGANGAKELCMEFLTSSHEDKDDNREGKEAGNHDMEASHGMERLSGERSEVGSFVDGTEDISSMSRRNRREPKVPGKLMPLLESLRTVVAHKFAPLFKHSQESQNNHRYDRLIRAHVDLGMIRARLEEGQYSGSLHFFRDLLLMVNNALVYYPRDTQEFGAAIGLRECIVKEMDHVLETEALLKQEGPSIRKRDLKMALDVPKEAGRPSAGKEEKRKRIKRLAANDSASGDLAINSREQSDVVGNVGSREISGKENLSLGHPEPTMSGKVTIDTLDLQVKGATAPQNEPYRGRTLVHESRLGYLGTRPRVEVKKFKESVLRNAINASAKDSKGRRVERRIHPQSRQGELADAGLMSEDPGMAKSEGMKSIAAKVHATRAQKLTTSHEPIKRGVGRPPKHFQEHISQKSKDPETRRKSVRR